MSRSFNKSIILGLLSVLSILEGALKVYLHYH
jgi:hypothetical protein